MIYEEKSKKLHKLYKTYIVLFVLKDILFYDDSIGLE